MSIVQADSSGVSGVAADPDAQLAMTAASAAAAGALRAGKHAPLFSLGDTQGRRLSLERLLGRGPVVLHFARGAWCSFGERDLASLAAHEREMATLGASAVAIVPCAGSPFDDAMPIRTLVDADMRVTRAFGLAFELPAALRPRYASLGYEPPVSRGRATWLVPIPATYLLDRDGAIALAYIDVDYRNGLDLRTFLTALGALRTREGAGRVTALREKRAPGGEG
ncbi:Peroxiredoxin [Paraburkholderia caballeronis]|uniref:Peroxiredoxin n=1 Tax=Paraburkholderia caballeronis TaxID=416943 RepID=A0A1H7SV66_9BURK|nr:peroxiredoxin [Paraburkholderia caballeronis]PXX01289.1 peroxiredoxin [Paraburkholderia caballeronis]RAJ99358.1 peroxiredoxin [Paraburkholderia caballeronis]SEE27178.1 Peroxiredoxin [Paraburkholderia caballeronis]SEL76552.1 Peroxiredoxin [Paraburkholderia caballeronis]